MHGAHFDQRLAGAAEVRALLGLDVDTAGIFRPNRVVKHAVELRGTVDTRDHERVARGPVDARREGNGRNADRRGNEAADRDAPLA